jgi:hypothetical protein
MTVAVFLNLDVLVEAASAGKAVIVVVGFYLYILKLLNAYIHRTAVKVNI